MNVSRSSVGPAGVWICCALTVEAGTLRRLLPPCPGVEIRVTGMGPERARGTVAGWLRTCRPLLVLNAGFAGGLNPALPAGTVLFATEHPDWARRLRAAGAVPGRFTTTTRILRTAAEKTGFWRATGADAVDMESEAVAGACRAAGVPVAIVRAISDGAGDDLPLDFPAFLREDGSLDLRGLTGAVWRRPRAWVGLWRLARQSRRAGRALAQVLARVLGEAPVECLSQGRRSVTG
ncbi:hypothetical protein [Limisphaera sp. 4302-co]|uniref:phosphorylase family protein n=1 Tax=Limisphaera sp. 4302-co TaxID=3400417 RepID=UPI003C1F2EE3